MTRRVSLAEADAEQLRGEVADLEAEVAASKSETDVLQVRQRAAGVNASEAPPPPLTTAGVKLIETNGRMPAGLELSEELREAIAGVKRLEGELEASEEELTTLDDELTEKEKRVELLE